MCDLRTDTTPTLEFQGRIIRVAMVVQIYPAKGQLRVEEHGHGGDDTANGMSELINDAKEQRVFVFSSNTKIPWAVMQC